LKNALSVNIFKKRKIYPLPLNIVYRNGKNEAHLTFPDGSSLGVSLFSVPHILAKVLNNFCLCFL